MIHSVLQMSPFWMLYPEKSLMSGCGKGKIKGKDQRICPELASFAGLFFRYIKEYQETSSNNEGNTETLRNMRKPFHQHCNFVAEISRPKTGEEPSRKEAQKKNYRGCDRLGWKRLKHQEVSRNPKCSLFVFIKWIKRQEKFGEIAGRLKGLELPWSWKYLKILSCRYLHVRCSIVQ